MPVKQTSSTIPLDLIQNVMRKPYRERFRIILSELGTGLGRLQDLNEVVRRAHPALRETGETIAILRRQNRLIAEFIQQADRVSAAVEPERENVARWAREASETSSIQASRSDQLARYWNRLPVFLGELEPTMAQLEATADQQIPTLQKLPGRGAGARVLPGRRARLRAQLAAAAARPGRRVGHGLAALRESKEEVDELADLAENAPRFGKPLRQFLQTIDDRRRSIDDDPEAGQRAPQRRTRRHQERAGVHGLRVPPQLRVLADDGDQRLRRHRPRTPDRPDGRHPVLALPGTAHQADPGPVQVLDRAVPAGRHRPDPTESDEAERELVELAKINEKRPADDKIPGAPGGVRATEPKPGQRDLSQPQIVLPEGIRALLGGNALPEAPPDPRLPDLPGSQQASPDPVIDFLLAP